MDLLTPASIRALLSEHHLDAKRSLGQNFLADPNTARRIANLAAVEPGDDVLEIGPGLGSLTLALLERGARVRALELDAKLATVLAEVVGDDAAVDVRVGDALRVPVAELLARDVDRDVDGKDVSDKSAAPGRASWTCVSNLPYNVAVPVVIRLLEEACEVERIVVLVQREVGERMAASPGDDQYGAVSVKVAYYSEASLLGVVPPTVFLPRPKVDSVLVGLVRRAVPPVQVPSTDDLFGLVRSGFGQRRKMLRRSLAPVLGDRTVDVLERAGVAPTARAETLGLDEWAAVARSAAVAA
ncbi:MAG: 16S rRNA (adenine(1518)-N(6)/adenine(1519)-N(6))-dimethyltransferase RsmA [Acidimicrobiia bacterium]